MPCEPINRLTPAITRGDKLLDEATDTHRTYLEPLGGSLGYVQREAGLSGEGELLHQLDDAHGVGDAVGEVGVPSRIIERHSYRRDAVDAALTCCPEGAGVADADTLVAAVVDARDDEVGTLLGEERIHRQLDAVHGGTVTAVDGEVAIGGAMLEAQGLGRGDGS